MRTTTTEVEVITTRPAREFAVEFTENEVRDILRAHVLNTMIPDHYRAARKSVPEGLAADDVIRTQLDVPTTQDEYDSDGKFGLTVVFGTTNKT